MENLVLDNEPILFRDETEGDLTYAEEVKFSHPFSDSLLG